MRIRDWINRNVGLGLLISLLLCAAGAALGAMLMDRELLAVESAGKWMAFMWLSASFVGCKVVASVLSFDTDTKSSCLSIS